MSFYDRNETALSVSDANKYIKALMDNDALLSAISIKGEISNLKYHTSGHLYFTLKDQDSEMSAVMFRSAAANMRFTAKNGMSVTAYGRISVYEKSGKYQIYVSAMTDNGIGDLRLEFERLYRKLEAEGLFAQARKKKLPKIPSCIGIVTSPTGAAVRDMINVTGRRWPSAKILIYPSLVQGEGAPESLCRGLELMEAYGACDVIIIGRGGGSIEDLWAFNDERVVRAVADCSVPIISAVGHETDFTLCDFVADCRAPTPSAAAEIAVPDREEWRLRVDEALSRLENVFGRTLQSKASKLNELSARLALSSPEARLEREKSALLHREKLLRIAIEQQLRTRQDRLVALSQRLVVMNPLSILSRGYTMGIKQDGRVASSASMLEAGESLKLIFADGSANAQISSVNVEQGE